MIRGGYGATSFFEGYSFNQRLTSSPPFSLAINSNAPTPTATSGGSPFTVTDAFSQPLGINNSLYSVWPQNTQPAYIHQYSFTVEQAITNTLSLSVGYHGQNGFHLADYRNGNQLTLAQAVIANPTITAVNAAGGNCNTTPFPAAAQPPYYSLVGECGLILVTESEGRMNYNAGQVTLRQRPTHHLEYSLNYTWAKSLTNSSGNYAVANTTANGSTFQNAYDMHADWGPSGMDIRHSMNFVGVYHLPFGRGQAYGGNVNRGVDAALGGWKLATSALIYSGFPITMFAQGNSNTFNTYGFNRPNQYRPLIIRNRTIDNWWGTDPSATPCTNRWRRQWNLCLRLPRPVHLRHRTQWQRTRSWLPPGRRLLVQGLPYLGEQHVLGFRADFFNIFNIASYGNPDSGITDGPTNFGNISNQGGVTRSNSRQIQLSLHYAF